MAITYTPTTNFGAKDSLPTNDPDKVIKGSEFTTEFTAIQTAFSLAAPNASPTFTGTVTIPTADINGGNIDGTVIGAATPAAGSFTNLTATGTTTLAGASTTADITFGDNDKAIFGAGSDLEIYHDGTRNYIDSDTTELRLQTSELRMVNSSNTEIGLKAVEDGAVTLYYDASEKLATTSTGIDVTGTITADGLTVDGVADFNANNINYTGSSPRINFFENDATDQNASLINTTGDFFVRTVSDDASTTTDRIRLDHSTGDISFYEDTGTTPKFFWDASAERLGLGTTSPSTLVELFKTDDAVLRLNYGGSGGNDAEKVFGGLEFYSTHSNYGNAVASYVRAVHTRSGTGHTNNDSGLTFGTSTATNDASAVERMRIEAVTGNVGIGTSSPAYPLDVFYGTGNQAVAHFSGNRSYTGRGLEIGTFSQGVADGGAYLDAPAATYGTLAFKTIGAEAMRITSNGHLLVNTTSGTTPGNNSAYLVVESDSGSAQEGIYIRSDGGTGDPAFVVGDSSNVAQLNIYGDGDVENTNGTYGTISDARVKENITDAGSQWDDFKALRVRKYNLISKPDEPHIGVIAQELEEAGMAGLVKETRQDGMKSVKTSILYMKAIKALQEAMERIEILEAEVAALKGA